MTAALGTASEGFLRPREPFGSPGRTMARTSERLKLNTAAYAPVPIAACEASGRHGFARDL